MGYSIHNDYITDGRGNSASRNLKSDCCSVGPRLAIFHDRTEMPFLDGFVARLEELGWPISGDHFDQLAVGVNGGSQRVGSSRSGACREHGLDDIKHQLAHLGIGEWFGRTPCPRVSCKGQD